MIGTIYETFKEYYEVRTETDNFGMWSGFQSEVKALEAINRYSAIAKKNGYNIENNRYIIVCCQECNTRDDKGNFLREEIIRFVVAQVQYDIYEEAFVFAY